MMAFPIRDLTVLITCMLLTGVNLIDVYGSVALWCASAIPASCIGAIIAVLRFPGNVYGRLLQLGLMLLAQFAISPIVLFNETTLFHVLPTASTLFQGFQAIFTSWKTIIGVHPPIARLGGAPVALWTIMLWMTFLAGAFLARSNADNISEHTRSATTQSETMQSETTSSGAITAAFLYACGGMLIIWLSLALCNLLGVQTDHARTQYCIGCVLALTQIIWLKTRQQQRFPTSAQVEISQSDSPDAAKMQPKQYWNISLTICCIVLIVTPIAGMPLGARLTLRNWYTPPIDVYGRSSPLSGMRRLLKQHSNDVVLSVTGLPAGTPIRLAVMDYFDGNVWSFADDGASAYQPIETYTGSSDSENQFTATFTIGNGLDDIWLPLAGKTHSITTSTDTKEINLLYDTETDTALFVRGTFPGMSYTVSGTLPRVPDATAISDCASAVATQPKARNVPDSVNQLATVFAGSRSSAGQTALSLEESLSSLGWFSHGIGDDYPSLAGHGSYRIDLLLTGDVMVGDSEQYASAMALMAREFGLPSRVVLGFTPDGSNTAGTRMEFTGDDIRAWVEIKLQHYGWVAFDPTPSESRIPDDTIDASPPDPQSAIRQPGVPLADRIREETKPSGHSTVSGQDADASQAITDMPLSPLISALYITSASCGLLLLAVLGILACNAMLIYAAQRRGSPAQRIVAGWNTITDLALCCGVDMRGTRRDQSARIIAFCNTNASNKRSQRNCTPFDKPMLIALCSEADKAVFSNAVMSEQQAREYWAHVLAIRRWMLQSVPKSQYWKIRLSVRRRKANNRKNEEGLTSSFVKKSGLHKLLAVT